MANQPPKGIKYNDLVEVVCECGITKTIRYRLSRYKNWKCASCAAKLAYKEGRIKPNTANLNKPSEVSENNKLLWQNEEYRKKILSSRKPKFPKHIDVVCPKCGKVRSVNRRYSLSKNSSFVGIGPPTKIPFNLLSS